MDSNPSNKILFVTDIPEDCTEETRLLQVSGHAISIETDITNLYLRFERYQPAVLILNLQTIDYDSENLCRRCRALFDGPLMVLMNRNDRDNSARLLNLGVDAFMTKPCDAEAFLDQVSTLLKREKDLPENGNGHLSLGCMEIDSHAQTVTLGGREVYLTRAEFDILWLMSQNPGKVVTRDELFRNLRGIDYDGLNRFVDIRIARVRKKLNRFSRKSNLIKSVFGIGYRLDIPAEI